MGRSPKSIAAALALLGASGMFALGLGEASLRLFPQLMPEEFQRRLHQQEANAEIVSEADPYLGFVYPPHYAGRLAREGGEFAFSYTTDAHGFRNPSPWPERADIVVLGDSMAFGYGVDDDEAWTALMADRLPGARIINLGLIGAAPQQYLRVHERFGQALRPGLVLFCLFPGNDLRDAGRFSEWLQAGSPGNYEVWSGHGDARGLLRQSYLVTFLRQIGDSLGSRFSGRTIDFPDGGQLQLVPDVYAVNELLARPEHPNFRLVLDAVEQTRALAAATGGEFLVLLVPTKEEVYLPLLDERPPPGTAAFAAHFRATGIPYLDLTPSFQARARAGERLFFEIDGHPNAAGYRLFADVVLDQLQSPAAEAALTRRWSDRPTQD
jgi:lysophospholipase L1-like esterase